MYAYYKKFLSKVLNTLELIINNLESIFIVKLNSNLNRRMYTGF